MAGGKSMLNLILIDDDAFNIKYLERLICWEEFGFQKPVCFSDSSQAVEYLKENSVDAIITDIKMPTLTGLDIARFCERNSPKTKIILFSAYRDFEYARMAIQLGNIIDYVQKPIDYEEFSDRLKILAKACVLESRQEFMTNEQMGDNLQFFTNLFCGQIKEAYVLKSEMEKIGIYGDIDKMQCTQIKFHINNFSEYLLEIWKHDFSRIYYALTKMYSPENENGYFFLAGYAFDKVDWAVLHKTTDVKDTTDDFCATFIRRAKSLLSLDISVASVQSANLSDFLNNSSELLDMNSDLIKGDTIIEKVYEYMHENYDKDISLGEAADYVHISQSYLSLYFKKVTKKNFIEGLTEIRMQNAIKFLSETSYSIEKICDMVGYKNLSHFRNVFKKYFGVTPAKYRKQSKSIGD